MTWIDTLDPIKVAAGLTKIRASAYGPAHPALDYAGGDEHFALFLAVADSKCQRITGLGVFDLEDYLWRDAYDSGLSPSEALHGCLVDNGYIGEE